MFFKGWGRQLAMFHLEAAAYDVRPGAAKQVLLPPRNAHNLPASSLLVNRPTWVFWLFLRPPDNAGTQFDRVSYFLLEVVSVFKFVEHSCAPVSLPSYLT